MAKVITIVDKDGGLIATIGEKEAIVHNDYKLIESEESEE